MIDRLIAFSARNAFIVGLLMLAITGGGVWAIRNTPIDAIPDLSDVQVIVTANWEGRSPDAGRRPGHLPDRHGPALRAQREGGAWLLLLRRVVRLRHLRGRHRPLLGAQPRARVPQRPPGPAARGRDARCSAPTPPAWAGASSTRSSTAAARTIWRELRTLNDWYVRYWLRSVPGVAEVAPVGGFVKQYQVEIDPERPARLRHVHRHGHRRHPQEQQRRGRTRGRVDGPGVHGAWARLPRRASPTSSSVSLGARPDGTPVLVERRRPRADRPRHAPRRGRPQRRRRRRRRHRRDPLGRRHLRRHRGREGRAHGRCSRRCRRAWSS